MAKPQFKNSKLPIDRAVGQTDQVSVSFWFNIEDPALNAQLEQYYVLHDKKPGMEVQVKVGDQYMRVSRFNLFIDDERKNSVLAGAPDNNIAAGAPPAAPVAAPNAIPPQTAPSAPPPPQAPAMATPQTYAQAKGGGYGFGS